MVESGETSNFPPFAELLEVIRTVVREELDKTVTAKLQSQAAIAVSSGKLPRMVSLLVTATRAQRGKDRILEHFL